MRKFVFSSANSKVACIILLEDPPCCRALVLQHECWQTLYTYVKDTRRRNIYTASARASWAISRAGGLKFASRTCVHSWELGRGYNFNYYTPINGQFVTSCFFFFITGRLSCPSSPIPCFFLLFASLRVLTAIYSFTQLRSSIITDPFHFRCYSLAAF